MLKDKYLQYEIDVCFFHHCAHMTHIIYIYIYMCVCVCVCGSVIVITVGNERADPS